MNLRRSLKKIIPAALALGAVLLVIMFPSHAAHAQSISSVTSGVIGYFVFGITWIVAEVAGVVIAFLTYLIGIILQLSGNAVNTLAVQTGFSVTLAIANLGFILALIIIAIQTILQRVTAKSKGSLWKLIVAAILVNFSLVIGGVIINFANTFTNAFLNQLPGGSNSAAAGTSLNPLSSGSMGFASELAGAFSPQRFLLYVTSTPAGTAAGGNNFWSNIINSFAAGTGPLGSAIISTFTSGSASTNSLANLITPIIELVSAAAFLIVIVIVLAVFLVLLLTRYVTLAILLIAMPFAWLLWIFPGTSKMWKQWWNTFIRWTFFAPVVVFFLWLAIATAQAMNSATGSTDFAFLNGGQYQAQVVGVLGGVSGAFGSTIGTFAVAILQGVVVVGLAIGGMIAANKLGIEGAKMAINGASSVGNAAKGYALNQGKKGSRWVGRKAGVDKAVQNMREGKINLGAEKLKNIPIAGKAAAGAQWAANRVGSITGRKVQPRLTNEDLVEEANKHVPSSPQEIKDNLKGNMNMQDTIAHINKLREKGELDDGVMVRNMKVADWLDANEKTLKEGYGQGKALKDADKSFGSSKEMRDANRRVEKALSVNDIAGATNAMADLRKETEALVAGMKKEDMAKMNVNAVFGKETRISNMLARQFALVAPQLITGMLPKLKSKNLKSFNDMYPGIIEEEANRLRKEGDTKKADQLNGMVDVKDKKGNVIDRVLDKDSVLGRYKRTYGNNVTGLGGTGTASGGGAGGEAGH